MKKYKTLKALYKAVKAGEVDESKLRVVMDNDCSTVEFVDPAVPYDDIEGAPVLYDGNGYYDTEDLWPLLFPKATVEWC